jgi:hypothetical protein
MASDNDKIMIPVPTMGLREDVDRSVSDANMIVSGENVVSVDGTIRPRPCHKLSSINGNQGLSWGISWNGATEAGTPLCVDEVSFPALTCLISAYLDESTGDNRVIVSLDEGASWDVITSNLDGLSHLQYVAFKEWQLSGIDNLFVAVLYPGTLEPFFYITQSVTFPFWLADPLNATFQLVFMTRALVLDPRYYPSKFDRLSLDSSDNWIYCSFARADRDPAITVYKFEDFDHHYILDFSPPPGITKDSIKFLFADMGHIWCTGLHVDGDLCLIDYTASSGQSQTSFVLHRGSAHSMTTILGGGSDPSGDPVFVGGDLVVKFNGSSFELLMSSGSAEFKLYGHDGTNEFALGQSLFMTSDGWANRLQLQSSPSTDMRKMTFIEYSASPGDYNWFALGSDPSTGVVNIYDMPDDQGDDGECTSVFQVDLSIDPYAIFCGTTQKLLRFNRSTSQWENISFGFNSDSANYPDSSVTFPPAGGWGLPNDSYLLGGSREYNPVIFRTFEVDDYTWVLAANGVSPPFMWRSGIADDEFTPIGQPGKWGGVGFIKAPPAKSMAIVGSRMVLAIGDYGLTFSAVNDHRKGWDASAGDLWTTYALLGDTPGKVVTIQEITALTAAIYKEDAIYHLITQAEFLGQNAPFRFELVKAGISGPCSQLSVVRMLDGRQAYLANDGGVYLYDGVNPMDAGRHIRKAIQRDLDEYSLGLSWGMVDPVNKVVWFFYPTQNGKTNRGIMLQVDQPPPWPAWRITFPFGWDMAAGGRLFNFGDKSIGSFGTTPFGVVPDALGEFASGFYTMSLARADNTWYTQRWDDDGDYTDAGIPISLNWLHGWEAGGDPFRFMTAQECQHLINSDDPNFQIGFRIHAEQANVNDIEIDDIEYIGPGSHYSRTTHRITGRRFAPEFLGSISRAFRWGGLGLYYYMRGLR